MGAGRAVRAHSGAFTDQGDQPASNALVADMVREQDPRDRGRPRDGRALCPTDYPVGTKRPCLDTGYYDTFNLAHVRLVDLRADPIATVTEAGIDTADESFDFDAIVFATGFDAMTGPLLAVDVTRRDGATLAEAWAPGRPPIWA